MGKPVLAHRLSFTLENGEIPDRLLVLHRCDVPLCVRPSHLFCGTHLDNHRDCQAKGRDPTRALKPDQVREIRRLFGTMLQTEIAAIFKVHPGVISKIKVGKSYTEIV